MDKRQQLELEQAAWNCGWSNYRSEYRRSISSRTVRCVICGSPRGGFCSDGKFYCVEHLPLECKIRS